MNELTGILGAWLLIVAIVVALDVGPEWVREKRQIWTYNHPKAVKPVHGRHRARR
ncbi:hypothetical protein SEA_ROSAASANTEWAA_44 [Streptomyces phage RosaAsantewaa]|nr:hypothetical protein SEA_ROSAASANTEWAA_44 [Streptomyces phage RosaAsantewaa]